ncbi:hypothetical protein EZY14_015995 [Kordia sp. TARA_039_SRF]|nr:hypothetical protein EZY14_015995 [Kordia sp. TARA_039_SRF]
MLKNIKNVGGVKQLSKTEQNAIHGGRSGGIFICANDCSEGDQCAYPDGSGGYILGTVQNGRCV